ncbi:MAG: hypothetical protein PHO08_08760 [Methylococcales bacterium]|nr:hypothetical protein [Methylococcales bacterium]
MKHITLQLKWLCLCQILAVILVLQGCTEVLVKDETQHSKAGTAPCSGSEWTDNSSLSVLPIPVVSLLIPHAKLNNIKADDYLKKCGDTTKLVNREVNVGYGACIPAVVTRLITLGIWQWCPAHVTWEADVQP